MSTEAEKERNSELPKLSFSFCHLFPCKWLTNREVAWVIKDMIRFLIHCCFLECQCLRSKLHAKHSNGYCGLSRLLEAPFTVIDTTGSPDTCFEPHWTPGHCGFATILCSWDFMDIVCKSSAKKQQWTLVLWLSPVLWSHWTSLTKHKYKDSNY